MGYLVILFFCILNCATARLSRHILWNHLSTSQILDRLPEYDFEWIMKTNKLIIKLKVIKSFYKFSLVDHSCKPNSFYKLLFEYRLFGFSWIYKPYHFAIINQVMHGFAICQQMWNDIYMQNLHIGTRTKICVAYTESNSI